LLDKLSGRYRMGDPILGRTQRVLLARLYSVVMRLASTVRENVEQLQRLASAKYYHWVLSPNGVDAIVRPLTGFRSDYGMA
jgi:hypothetical protein